MYVQALLKDCEKSCPTSIEDYRAGGGYEALSEAVLKLSPEALIERLKESGLLGRGGARFPTWRKWSFVHERAPHPRYVVANTDEMEPGTFKDRYLVNTNPHLVIEGLILAGYAIMAQKGFYFIRPTYEKDAQLMERELGVAREAGVLGKNILGSNFSFDITVHRSAGRYICGEATAQVQAIMGKRAHPSKTVHMTDTGLWDKPTVVNNAETYRNYVRTGTAGFGLGLKYKAGAARADLGYLFQNTTCNMVDVYAVPGHGSAMLGFPRHKLTLSSSLPLGTGLSLNPSAAYVSKRYGYGAGGALKAFGERTVANLALQLRDRPLDRLTLSLGVRDLFNSNYSYIQPYTGGHAPLPAPARELFLKAVYDF